MTWSSPSDDREAVRSLSKVRFFRKTNVIKIKLTIGTLVVEYRCTRCTRYWQSFWWFVKYPQIKAEYPELGRRKWRLRVLHEFWLTQSENDNRNRRHTSNLSGVEPPHDGDPLDVITECDELGLLVRTDYSNEEAWKTFYDMFQTAEQEIIDAMAPEILEADDAPQAQENVTMKDDEDSDSSEEVPSSIIKVINPKSLEDREALIGISNLTALRLFNEVDIRPIPQPPLEGKRISHPTTLIDQGGWQEIYSGKTIWIYDRRSNDDFCLRLVSQLGDVYGTATGDSWRARVSHICELQFNMSCLGMKIDFGGLDRWDHNERQRNITEAKAI